MIVIAMALIGAGLGGMTAKRRRGNGKDIAQYMAVYALIFIIIGMFVTIIIDRIVS